MFKNKFIYIVLILILIIGVLLGRYVASVADKSYIIGENRLKLILSVPPKEIISLNQSLYSINQLKRAAAYYGLNDYKMYDLEFLEERYSVEQAIYVKKIIITIIVNSDNKKEALDFLQRILKDADGQLKIYILLQIKELNSELFNKLYLKTSKKFKQFFKKINKQRIINQEYII